MEKVAQMEPAMEESKKVRTTNMCRWSARFRLWCARGCHCPCAGLSRTARAWAGSWGAHRARRRLQGDKTAGNWKRPAHSPRNQLGGVGWSASYRRSTRTRTNDDSHVSPMTPSLSKPLSPCCTASNAQHSRMCTDGACASSKSRRRLMTGSHV